MSIRSNYFNLLTMTIIVHVGWNHDYFWWPCDRGISIVSSCNPVTAFPSNGLTAALLSSSAESTSVQGNSENVVNGTSPEEAVEDGIMTKASVGQKTQEECQAQKVDGVKRVNIDHTPGKNDATDGDMPAEDTVLI